MAGVDCCTALGMFAPVVVVDAGDGTDVVYSELGDGAWIEGWGYWDAEVVAVAEDGWACVAEGDVVVCSDEYWDVGVAVGGAEYSVGSEGSGAEGDAGSVECGYCAGGWTLVLDSVGCGEVGEGKEVSVGKCVVVEIGGGVDVW